MMVLALNSEELWEVSIGYLKTVDVTRTIVDSASKRERCE